MEFPEKEEKPTTRPSLAIYGFICTFNQVVILKHKCLILEIDMVKQWVVNTYKSKFLIAGGLKVLTTKY